MGNQTSIVDMFSGASVNISLDDSCGVCFGGSLLRGNVSLTVNKNSISADSLVVNFFGREQIVDNGGDSIDLVCTEKNFNIELMLCNFGGTVVQGRYEFPFELSLPPIINGKKSFNIGSYDYSIDYHLEANLQRNSALAFYVKKSIEVLIADAPYRGIPTPIFLTPKPTPVRFLSINSGTLTLWANLDSNNVCIYETFRLSYEIRNDSNCRIKALVVKVNEVQTFSVKRRVDKKTICLFQKRIESTEHPNVFLNPMSGTSTVVECQEFDSNPKRRVHFIDLCIPNTACPSFTGKFGRAYHFVELKLKTPTGVSISDFTLPLIVHAATAIPIAHRCQ